LSIANIPNGSTIVTYNGTNPSVTLQGNGIAAALKAPSMVPVAPAAAGVTGAARSIKVSNSSTIGVTLDNAPVKGGMEPNSFRITTDQCSGRTLMPRGTCNIAVAFAPPANATGTLSATLSLGFSYGSNLGSVSTTLSSKVK
jgi:hypothetical protein